MKQVLTREYLHRNRGVVLAFSFYLIFSVFVFRGILQPGFVGNGDQVLIGSSAETSLYRYAFVLDPFEHAGKLNFELPRYPLIALFSVIGQVLTLDVSNRILIILSSTVGFYTMFLLSRRLLKNSLAAFLAGLFFGVNPWVISRVLSGHMSLLLAYGLIPLFLLFYFESVGFPSDFVSEKPLGRRFRSMLLAALSLAVVSSTVMLDGLLLSLSVVSVLLLSWVLFALLSKGVVSKRLVVTRLVVRTFVVVSAALLLCSYWLLPFAAYTLSSSSAIGSSDILVWLHQNLSLENVLRLKGYWWLEFSESLYSFNSNVLDGFAFVLSWLPFILLMNTVPLVRSSRERLTWLGFYALFVLGVVLSLGVNFLGPFYRYFEVSGVFRDPDKYGALMAFAYALFIGVFADKATRFLSPTGKLKKGVAVPRRYLAVFVVLLLAGSHLFTNWPVLTGDFRGSYSSLDMPKAYSEVNGWLNVQSGDFRVLWLPSNDYLKYDWSKNRSIAEPVRYSSEKPTIQMVDPARDASPWTSLSVLQLNHLLEQNVTRHVGVILGLMNVKYVVFRSDVVSPSYPDMLSSLKAQKELRLVLDNRPLYVFENTRFLPKVRVPSESLMVVDGAKGLSRLSSIVDNFSDTSLLYLEDVRRSGGDVAERFKDADAFFFSIQNFQDLFLASLPQQYLYDAFDGAAPSAVLEKYAWVQAVFEQESRGSLFYGRGIAETHSGNAVLDIPIRASQAANYDVWVRLFGESWLYTVSIDGTVLSPTRHPTNQGFKWVEYQDVKLNASDHLVRIVANNQSYLHAVDEVVVVPRAQSEAAKDTLTSLLAEKPFFVYVEAEEAARFGSSKYVMDQDFSEKIGLFLNGSASFTNGSPLVVPSDNSFEIGLRGRSISDVAHSNIYLQSSVYNTSSMVSFENRLDWYFSAPVDLKKGEYRVFVNGTGVDLDALVVFRAGDERLLTQRETSSGGVLLRSQVPTEMDVSAVRGIDNNGAGSSTLVYSASFNSNWAAKVGGSSEKPYLCNIFSICVDVPSGSTVDARLEYGVQRFGYAGYALSLGTLFLMVFLLVGSGRSFGEVLFRKISRLAFDI